MTFCASRACMSSERCSRALALLGALVCALACADFSRGEPLAESGLDGGSTGNGSDGGSSVGYAADIHPLLLDGCAECHSPTGSASNTQLVLTGRLPEDYLSARELVDQDSPDASRLLTKMQGRGHVGGAIYTSASPEYALILRWIDEGATP